MHLFWVTKHPLQVLGKNPVISLSHTHTHISTAKGMISHSLINTINSLISSWPRFYCQISYGKFPVFRLLGSWIIDLFGLYLRSFPPRPLAISLNRPFPSQKLWDTRSLLFGSINLTPLLAPQSPSSSPHLVAPHTMNEHFILKPHFADEETESVKDARLSWSPSCAFNTVLWINSVL